MPRKARSPAEIFYRLLSLVMLTHSLLVGRNDTAVEWDLSARLTAIRYSP
jgi:hypothetical protein